MTCCWSHLIVQVYSIYQPQKASPRGGPNGVCDIQSAELWMDVHMLPFIYDYTVQVCRLEHICFYLVCFSVDFTSYWAMITFKINDTFFYIEYQ